MLSDLQRHPDSNGGDAFRVAVEIGRPEPALLALRYRVTGPLRNLRLPPAAPPARTDELWRQTCFEAFVMDPGGGYLELNFAPSSQWAAYRFDGYRAGMAALAAVAAPRIATAAEGDQLEVRVAADLGGVDGFDRAPSWRLGVSVVLEDSDGRISYWALAHAPGKPDFHHPDGFAFDLAITESR